MAKQQIDNLHADSQGLRVRISHPPLLLEAVRYKIKVKELEG